MSIECVDRAHGGASRYAESLVNNTFGVSQRLNWDISIALRCAPRVWISYPVAVILLKSRLYIDQLAWTITINAEKQKRSQTSKSFTLFMFIILELSQIGSWMFVYWICAPASSHIRSTAFFARTSSRLHENVRSSCCIGSSVNPEENFLSLPRRLHLRRIKWKLTSFPCGAPWSALATQKSCILLPSQSSPAPNFGNMNEEWGLLIR